MSVSESIGSMKVDKPLLNIVLNFMKSQPKEFVRGELDSNEMRNMWQPLFETLKVAEPAYDIDMWMTYWWQISQSTVEKRTKIRMKKSKARWTELDEEIYQILGCQDDVPLLGFSGFAQNSTARPAAPKNSIPQSYSLSLGNTIARGGGTVCTSTQNLAGGARAKTLYPRDAPADTFGISCTSTASSGRAPSSQPPPLAAQKSNLTDLQLKNLNAMQEGNKMMATLGTHVQSCLKAHTEILEQGFKKIQETFDKLVEKIIITFLSGQWKVTRTQSVGTQDEMELEEQDISEIWQCERE